MAAIVLAAAAMGLAACDSRAMDAMAPQGGSRERAVANCHGMRGRYIAEADVVRRVGTATVMLPGPDWCERPMGPSAATFYSFAGIVAWSDAGRAPTPSEGAHSFFLAALGVGPPDITLDMARDLDGLRAALEADLRAGLAPGGPTNAGPGLLVWEHGPNFRTISAEVGATPPGSNCVPTRVVHDAYGNPRFPAGTVLRLVAHARYCLAPGDSPPAHSRFCGRASGTWRTIPRRSLAAMPGTCSSNASSHRSASGRIRPAPPRAGPDRRSGRAPFNAACPGCTGPHKRKGPARCARPLRFVRSGMDQAE